MKLQNRITPLFCFACWVFPCCCVTQRLPPRLRTCPVAKMTQVIAPDRSRALRGKYIRLGCRRNLDVHHVRTHRNLERFRAIACERAPAWRKSWQPHFECFRCSALSCRRRRRAFSCGHPARGDFSVVSWVQGTFRIHQDQRTGADTVTQDSASFETFDPVTRKFALSGIRDIPLDELRSQVAAALRQKPGAQK